MSDSPCSSRIGVVMAGGSGERFWPLSRVDRPKQLLALTDSGQTLLAEAVDRLEGLIPRDRVFIATGRHLVEPIQAANLVPPENVLGEPCKRNTTGCLVYVAAQCLHRFGDDARNLALAITTADHRIGDPDRFREVLAAALEIAEREAVLATIGIPPSRAETGFGYMGVPADGTRYAGTDDMPAYKITEYIEKPKPVEKAQALVDTGCYYWNSGMFCWRLGAFLDELQKVEPETVKVAHEVAAALDAGDERAEQESFERLKDISIDYALMENTKNIVMVRGDFPWDDVGAWDALDRLLPDDAQGNVVVGGAVTEDTKNCVIYNEPGADRLALGVVGVEGLMIVATEDAVLVLPKERAQDVRKVVAALKERGASQV